MTDRELQDLRRRLGPLPRGPGRRFPTSLRERITAWARPRHAAGTPWRDLARELAVPARTLKRWALSRRDAPVALRPIAVLDAPTPRTLTLVAPSGARIEGVTVDEAIAILRGLA